MKMVAKLTVILKSTLEWNKARIDLISSFLIALIMVRTVNLTEIASAMPGKASQSSKYRRLKRFFEQFQVCYRSIAFLIVKLLPISDESWDLSSVHPEIGISRHEGSMEYHSSLLNIVKKGNYCSIWQKE